MSEISADVDELLRDLRAACDAATANLLELESDGTYALLKAGGGLSGVTASRARPALERVPELWRGLELLDGLLDRAERRRGKDRLNDARRRDLRKLLTTASITMPADPVPLAARGLTTAAVVDRKTTPQDLLVAMEAAFTPLRDVVAEVDAAWRDLLPRVERAGAEADRLAQLTPDHRGVAAARRALVDLPNRLAEDPLGTAEQVAEVEAVLVGVRSAMASARAQVDRLRDDLADAARSMDELERLVDEGREGLARSRAEIADPRGLLDPLGVDVLLGEHGLRPWLERLSALAAPGADAGAVQRAGRGFARWRTVADQTLAAARQVAEANLGPIRRRQELFGLLRAARAKAAASGLAEDPALAEKAREAQQALAAPCRLAVAQGLVRGYLVEVRRLAGSSAVDNSEVGEP